MRPNAAKRGHFSTQRRSAVHLTDYRAIAWGDEIDICADALYMELTGKTLEELALAEQSAPANA